MRFIRNVSWSALGQAGAWAVSFLVTPYLVRRMGVETYGLYLILMMVSSYLMLLTFNAGTTTVIKTAELVAARNGQSLRRLLELSLGAHGLFVLAGALVLLGAAPWVAGRFFNIPAALEPSAVWILRCAGFGAFFVSMAQLGTSVLQGLQRFDLQNGVALAQSILIPLGAVAVFAAGGTLSQAAGLYVLLNAAVAAASLWAARAQLQGRRLLEEETGTPLEVGPLVSGTMTLWLIQWAALISTQFDRLFIGHALSLQELTFYAVPAGLLMRLQTIPQTLSSVVMPMVSELSGPQTEEGLSRMYLKSVRAVLWAVLPALVLLFSLMPQFLTLWLGPEFGMRSVWPARLLVFAHGAALLAFLPNTVACARYRPQLPGLAAWAQALISMAAWCLLIPRLGILGVALGFLLGQSLPMPFLLLFVHRRLLHLSSKRFVRESLAPPLASAALLLAFVFPLHAWAGTWARLLGLSALGLVLYYGSTWFFMSPSDRGLIKDFLRYRRAEG